MTEIRILAMTCVSLLMVTLVSGQSEAPDPYFMSLVGAELKMNSDGQRVISSWSQKRLATLGDRVSVSILKILQPAELRDPQTVQTCLFIIEEAFTQPNSISLEADKDPRVTLFLLQYFREAISDPDAREKIQNTVHFVKSKTGH
jgi:hypothetical protein